MHSKGNNKQNEKTTHRLGENIYKWYDWQEVSLQIYNFSRGSSPPRDWTRVSCTAGRSFTIWATREAYQPGRLSSKNPQIVNAGYLPSLSVGCKLVQTLWRTVWRVHKKLKTRVSIWCCNPIPGHIFGEKTWSKSIYVPPMLIEGLFTMATLFHFWKYFVDFHFSKAENLCLDDIFSPFYILLQILNF